MSLLIWIFCSGELGAYECDLELFLIAIGLAAAVGLYVLSKRDFYDASIVPMLRKATLNAQIMLYELIAIVSTSIDSSSTFTDAMTGSTRQSC